MAHAVAPAVDADVNRFALEQSPSSASVGHLLIGQGARLASAAGTPPFTRLGLSGLVPLCERADVVRQTAGIVASPSDLTFDLWTDGACAGNPGGPGGYAAILVARRADGSIAKQREVSDGEAETTNNRMELKAVIAGLRALTAPARVRIHIDSS